MQYNNLKATIASNVYENHRNLVTAEKVKTAMNAMTDSLGAGYQYLGVATQNTTPPESPDYKCFYIAAQPGTYTNFSGLVVNDGEVAVLKWDTAWTKEVTGAATASQVTELVRAMYGDNFSLDGDDFTVEGYILYSTGAITSSGYHCTDKLYLPEGAIVDVTGYGGSPSTAVIGAYDSSNNYLQAKSVVGGGAADFTYVVPSGVAYIRLCSSDGALTNIGVAITIIPIIVKRSDVSDDINGNDDKIPTLGLVKEQVAKITNGISYGNDVLTIPTSLVYIGDGNLSTHTDFSSSDFIAVTPGAKFKCLFTAEGTAGVCFYNSSKQYLNQYWQSPGSSQEILTVPAGAAFVRFCNRHTVTATPYFNLVNEQYDDLTMLTDKVDALGGHPFSKPLVRLYPETKLPCVSFQFDDVTAGDAQLVTLFDSYHLTCAFAFIASTTNINNLAEIYKGYQKKGYQIMNHSVDGTIFNTNNYTYNTAMAAIQTALYRIEDAGMVCNGFVAPSSEMAAEFMPILRMFHAYAFTSATSSPTANGRNQDPCDIHRYSLQEHTLAEIEQYIDDCITNDQIATFYGHSADLVDGDTSVFSLAKIAAVIEYCIAKRNAGQLYVGGTDDCVKYFFDL